MDATDGLRLPTRYRKRTNDMNLATVAMGRYATITSPTTKRPFTQITRSQTVNKART